MRVWEALRYRRGQAVVLAVLSAIVTACAVFAPLAVHSIDESLVRARLAELTPGDARLTIRSNWSQTAPGVDWAQMRAKVTPQVAALHRPPVDTGSAYLDVNGETGDLVARAGACSHVRVQGSCPANGGQVMATARLAQQMKWHIGQQIQVQEHLVNSTQVPPKRTMTLVGTYQEPAGDPFWFGYALQVISVGEFSTSNPKPVTIDALITAPAGFEAAAAPTYDPGRAVPTVPSGSYAWTEMSLSVDYDLRADSLSYTSLPAATRTVDGLIGQAGSSGWPVTVTSPLPDVLTAVSADAQQARVIVPVLLAQLAILLLVVLATVLGSAVEQRSKEAALARLRGHGVGGARGMVLRELAVPLLLGVPLGVLLAYAVDALARATWLMPGVPMWFSPLVLLAVGVAVLAIAACLLLGVRRVGRGAIADLLRGVPPRRGAGARLADVIVVTAALVGVLAMATGALTGPIALATPSLLALACGVLLAAVLVPVAARAGAVMVRRGRLPTGVALAQIARRPSMRRIVTVATVATALVVFAANAYAVGERNRADRAAGETGAAMVLYPKPTDPSTDLATVQQAVHTVDPSGRHTTVVVDIYPGSSNGVQVVAVDPAQFARVAAFGKESANLSGIAKGAPPAIRITGTRLTMSVTSTQQQVLANWATSSGGMTWAAKGRLVDSTQDFTIPPVQMTIDLVRPDGVKSTVEVGTLPGEGKTATLSQVVPCAGTCTVTGWHLLPPADTDIKTGQRIPMGMPYRGQVKLNSVSMTGGSPGTLTQPSAWQPATNDSEYLRLDAPDRFSYYSGGSSQLDLAAKGGASVPPVLVTGAVRASGVTNGVISGSAAQVPSLSGQDVQAPLVAGSIPYVPGAAVNAGLVNLKVEQTLGFRIDGTLARIRILTNDPSSANQQAITKALAGNGIGLNGIDRAATLKRSYDRSASAWGLQLAVAVAVGALLISVVVLVLVMLMSWRERARDIAALRLSGVAGRKLRAASVIELLTLVTLAVLVGAVAGTIGSSLAMGRLPLFARPPDLPLIDLHLRPQVGVGVAVFALAVLAVVAVVLALRLVRQAALRRVQETV